MLANKRREKSVSSYILNMKGYMEQLECLGYVLPQDLSVGLIMNGLTSDFARFIRNYNMHNIGKTIGELHALLIEYVKGWKRISEKRTKNEAKTNKTEHGMEKREKDKVKSKPKSKKSKSTKSTPTKSKGQSRSRN
ncbi:hypothetical protein Tco_0840245 [Tanacetum coccineum]|uniref:Gag protein n=1 Tax=Tanacetum coccineum TaxID=301880 RepID=A0ABQ5ATW2_9ASTR